jgi:hypothetical protein
MYIRTLEGFRLGDGRPNSPPKDQLIGTCQAWVVNLPFKQDFKDFRAELWKAIGRHVEGQSNKSQLARIADGGIEALVKNFHSSLQSQPTQLAKLQNNVPIKATLHSSNGKLGWIELFLLGGFSIAP